MVVELKIQTISGAANGEPDGGRDSTKCNCITLKWIINEFISSKCPPAGGGNKKGVALL